MSKRIVQMILASALFFQANQSHALVFGVPLVAEGLEGLKDTMSDGKARLFVVGGGIFFALLGSPAFILGLILDDNGNTNLENLIQRLESFGAEQEEAANLALLMGNAIRTEELTGNSVTVSAQEVAAAAPNFSKSTNFAKFLSSIK